jgi:hypothetical protein
LEGTHGPLRAGARNAVGRARAASPRKFKGRTVRLEGTIKDVRQGEGCWVEVADDKGVSFAARSLDESVHFPSDCKGWHVVVQGRVTAVPTMHKWEAEPTDHTCSYSDDGVSTAGAELTPAR